MYGGLPRSSVPATRIDPRTSSQRPMIVLQSVDLPMPLRPIRAIASSPIENETPSRMCAEP